MELLHQPINGQLGPRLVELLDTSGYDTMTIVVAFAKTSGVLRMKDAFEDFRQRGGKIKVYVGVDLGGTSYEALSALLPIVDALNVIHMEGRQTFHPKIYYLAGRTSVAVNIGSHNLTAGGLWTNFESSAMFSLNASNASCDRLKEEMDAYVAQLEALPNSVMPIVSQEKIEELLESGYIVTEPEAQIRSAKSLTRASKGERLFGNGVNARLPATTNPLTVPRAPVTTGLRLPAQQRKEVSDTLEDTIWFETGAMTGGSRNILDLSKKSLKEYIGPEYPAHYSVEEGFIRGAVEYFGVDPDAIQQRTEVVLKFEGVDYRGNTILFPVGDRANGTWRIQIKGIDDSGRRLTQAFKDKNEGYYLVQKIVVFSRIGNAHYTVAVHPKSRLEEFRSASRILARNGLGQRARLFGIL